MISLKQSNKGFTIVELLIVIVVIGILALLVVTTFSGIQKKARDTERQTDIKAIHTAIEAYYGQNSKYPSLAQLNDSAWRSTNLKGLDSDALKDPHGTDSTVAQNASDGTYGYDVTPVGCDNEDVDGTDCTEYKLIANLEGGGTFEKAALQ